ncbi:MAG: hypothetical protein ACTTKH_04450 [Treponema sp.]
MDKEKIERIRFSLGDKEENTLLFSDKEIEEILQSTESESQALYILYLQKAGRLITNESYIKSIKAGNEELERLNAEDLQRIALKQADKYKELYEWEKKIERSSCFIY